MKGPTGMNPEGICNPLGLQHKCVTSKMLHAHDQPSKDVRSGSQRRCAGFPDVVCFFIAPTTHANLSGVWSFSFAKAVYSFCSCVLCCSALSKTGCLQPALSKVALSNNGMWCFSLLCACILLLHLRATPCLGALCSSLCPFVFFGRLTTASLQ